MPVFICSCLGNSEDTTYLPQCRDNMGQAVDWWVILKPPQTASQYFYFDSSSQGQQFKGPLEGLNSAGSGPLASTLQQFFNPKIQSQIDYVVYNDSPSKLPGTSNPFYDFSKSHSKGIWINMPNRGGFWITHSIPGFAYLSKEMPAYTGPPKSSKKFAQHLFCVSLTPSSP